MSTVFFSRVNADSAVVFMFEISLFLDFINLIIHLALLTVQLKPSAHSRLDILLHVFSFKLMKRSSKLKKIYLLV